ncbi:myrosinase 1-like [Arctopsyche grandis]|uniref:myrosinase 1-like n=1 Tax=Arctopsyche grandis TaxID=121162 RepID=UPI00406D69B3
MVLLNLYIVYFVVCILSVNSTCTTNNDEDVRKFPLNFAFGTATSAYQIEGAWNVSGKGENIWDKYVHKNPNVVIDKSNGDVACDSYHQYDRDIEMLKELGVDYYRFSLSWSRLLPTGSVANVNNDGVDYYNNLINGLLKHNIIPFVTIYHWDLPQKLQDLGGWTNPIIQDFFEDYANFVFRQFGDRVQHWLTFNEPKQICLCGYGQTTFAPGLNMTGVGDYMCGHNLLLSHARVFHLYDKKFRIKQAGSIGITIEGTWSEPFSSSKEDFNAAERFMEFEAGWFMNPIFSIKGDYPAVMKERIAVNSAIQGFSKSRLPEFTEEQIRLLKGSSDFLGLNFYCSTMARHINTNVSSEPSYEDDANVYSYVNQSWPHAASSWLTVTPWGFHNYLNRIKNLYDNPEVIITENGYSTWGGLVDNDRIKYINLHLNALLDAIKDGSKVTGYTVWSLMDNFEWQQGYSEKFGMYEVDFQDPSRKRIPRKSAKYFIDVIRTKSVKHYDPEYYEINDCTNSVYV